jgi:hypothetical protein
MSRYTRTAAGLVATLIAAAAAIPALGAAHTTSATAQTITFYDKPVTITLTDASGHVTSRPPYPQTEAGDVLDVYSLDYVGNHIHHATQWSMTSHLRCTFGHGAPVCESNVASGNSLLVFNGNKLVGATGHYQGATGRVLSNKPVSGSGNDSDIVVQINR